MTCARKSGDLFCTHTDCWWPVLYIWNFLIAYFVHTSVHIDLFSVNTTSSWLSLYTSDVNSLLFSLFASHHVIDILWVRARTFGDLFCTRTFSWWPILYIRNFLMALSLHIPPNVEQFSVSDLFLWPILYLKNFWWFILYKYNWMLTYFLWVPPLHDANFKTTVWSCTSPRWVFNVRNILWLHV